MGRIMSERVQHYLSFLLLCNCNFLMAHKIICAFHLCEIAHDAIKGLSLTTSFYYKGNFAYIQPLQSIPWLETVGIRVKECCIMCSFLCNSYHIS